MERNDLIRFYDRYISPHSVSRRKLALHVTPSSLALQTSGNANNVALEEDELATDPSDLSSTAAELDVVEDTTDNKETRNETTGVAEQPVIIDCLTKTDAKQTENALPQKAIKLPKVKSIIKLW